MPSGDVAENGPVDVRVGIVGGGLAGICGALDGRRATRDFPFSRSGLHSLLRIHLLIIPTYSNHSF